MSRVQRAKSETGIYHVLLRGINQQSVFEDAEDFDQFLCFLKEVKEISGFKLFAYCLMSNHVHLLIKEEGEPLSLVFKRLGARYVYWFNRKYLRTGHLFQDRFKSEPVETDAYFSTVLGYIHLNPVRARLSKKAADYQWSSLTLFEKRDSLIDWDVLTGIIELSEYGEPTSARSTDDKGTSPLDLSVNPSNLMRDEDARAVLARLCGVNNASDFQRLEKAQQRTVFSKLKGEGLSIRQIARITGATKGVVARWVGKNVDR